MLSLKNLNPVTQAPKKNSVVEIPKNQLLEFLRIAQYGSDKKLPVIFDFSEDSLICSLTDPALEIRYTLHLSNTTIGNSSLAINPHKLYEFLRKLEIKSDSIKMHFGENSVFIEHAFGRGEIVKSVIPDSCRFALDRSIVSYHLNQGVLAETFRILKNYISETGRDSFSGLNMEYDAQLKIWSTDGYTLCMSVLEAQGLPHSCIISRRFAECVASISTTEETNLSIYSACIAFKQKNLEIAAPLVNANILPVAKLFDAEDNFIFEIEVDSTELCKQIERVMIFSDDSKMLSLLYENGEGKIFSCGNTGGSGYEKLNGANYKCKGDEVKILIGGQQILYLLKTIKGVVSIRYYNSKSNILIRKGAEYPVYVMAVRKG